MTTAAPKVTTQVLLETQKFPVSAQVKHFFKRIFACALQPHGSILLLIMRNSRQIANAFRAVLFDIAA